MLLISKSVYLYKTRQKQFVQVVWKFVFLTSTLTFPGLNVLMVSCCAITAHKSAMTGEESGTGRKQWRFKLSYYFHCQTDEVQAILHQEPRELSRNCVLWPNLVLVCRYVTLFVIDFDANDLQGHFWNFYFGPSPTGNNGGGS